VLHLLGTDAGGERRIGDSDGLGMLVCNVVFLCVNLFVLLEVLRTLERLFAYLADVRLEWRVD
jgi:hypothetical protein